MARIVNFRLADTLCRYSARGCSRTSKLYGKFQPLPSPCDRCDWCGNGSPCPNLPLSGKSQQRRSLNRDILCQFEQVQIHALWGNLLVGFSVMRCLTYFFLWLGPPRSILPSRPPTEALGSFFLACGGLVFMFSTEELTFAAMRRGRDGIASYFNSDTPH